MKTIYFSLIFALIISLSCNSNRKSNTKNIKFEIFKTLSQSNLPEDIKEKLKLTKINFEIDTSSAIVGYLNKEEPADFLNEIGNNDIQFLATSYPVDNEKKYVAIVAVKPQPDINNPDIKKTKSKQNNVEVYFNYDGAKKWASFTKSSIGKMIAFSIDDKIYSLTSVNGEIKNGIAVLSGLENDETAKEISNSLNFSNENK